MSYDETKEFKERRLRAKRSFAYKKYIKNSKSTTATLIDRSLFYRCIECGSTMTRSTVDGEEQIQCDRCQKIHFLEGMEDG